MHLIVIVALAAQQPKLAWTAFDITVKSFIVFFALELAAGVVLIVAVVWY